MTTLHIWSMARISICVRRPESAFYVQRVKLCMTVLCTTFTNEWCRFNLCEENGTSPWLIVCQEGQYGIVQH